MDCSASAAHFLSSNAQFLRQKWVQGGEAEEELLAGHRNDAADIFEAQRSRCKGAETQAGGVADFPMWRGKSTQRDLEPCIRTP